MAFGVIVQAESEEKITNSVFLLVFPMFEKQNAKWSCQKVGWM